MNFDLLILVPIEPTTSHILPTWQVVDTQFNMLLIKNGKMLLSSPRHRSLLLHRARRHGRRAVTGTPSGPSHFHFRKNKSRSLRCSILISGFCFQLGSNQCSPHCRTFCHRYFPSRFSNCQLGYWFSLLLYEYINFRGFLVFMHYFWFLKISFS